MKLGRDELRALILAHQAEVLRYLRYLGADASTAEDLAQEAFLIAWKSRSVRAREEAGRAAWLRGVARNVFLMHCRRERRSPERVTLASLDEAEDVWQTEMLRGGDGFHTVEALRRCVAELDGKKRAAIDRRYAKGESRGRIAAVLGMTEDGVKSLLRRVRKALHDCITRRLAAEGSR